MSNTSSNSKYITEFKKKLDDLLSETIQIAVEDAVKPLQQEMTGKADNVSALSDKVKELENKLKESEANAEHWHKKYDEFDGRRSPSDIVLAFTGFLGELLEINKKASDPDIYSRIQRFKRDFENIGVEVLSSEPNTRYNEETQESVGSGEETDDILKKDKIKESVSPGFKFDKQYDKDFVREKVIRWIYTSKPTKGVMLGDLICTFRNGSEYLTPKIVLEKSKVIEFKKSNKTTSFTLVYLGGYYKDKHMQWAEAELKFGSSQIGKMIIPDNKWYENVFFDINIDATQDDVIFDIKLINADANAVIAKFYEKYKRQSIVEFK